MKLFNSNLTGGPNIEYRGDHDMEGEFALLSVGGLCIEWPSRFYSSSVSHRFWISAWLGMQRLR